MKVAPGLVTWYGQYRSGDVGLAIGRRAHWWIDWTLPARLAAACWWLAIVCLGGAFLVVEFLAWRAQYEGFVELLRLLLWLESPV